MFVSRLTCMFIALSAHRGLRDAALLVGMVQCKTVRVGVLCVKDGVRGLLSWLWAHKGRSGGGAESSLRTAWYLVSVVVDPPPLAADQWEGEKASGKMRRKLM